MTRAGVIVDVVLVLGAVSMAIDNVRLRRRLRVDRLAREAEEALGPPHIGDIVMPDPSDPRWKREEREFIGNHGFKHKELVLALGAISVTDQGAVYIGAGPPIVGGEAYGKRALHAHRRRLVEAARGST